MLNLERVCILIGAITVAVMLAMYYVGTARADGALPAPRPPDPAFATHNGSLMAVRSYGTRRLEIRYAEPKPGLWPLGVVPGTLLVRGQWYGPELRATAHIFAYHCGPVPYPVTGRVEGGGVLVLRGPAPIVDLYSCAIIDMAWTANSTLVFTPALPEG